VRCAGFDAYCATVYAPPEPLVDELQCLMESAGFVSLVTEGPKVKFYANNTVLVDPKGHRWLSVKSGGSNPHPWVECSGRASEALSRHLRGGIRHRPTRIDHAHDLRAAGLFDRMHDYAKALCKKHNLKLGYGGDWNTPDAGRTVYVGSRKSQVCVRIYEKGLEYAHRVGEPVTDQLRQWVRFELEFKPQTRTAKQIAHTLEGPQLWGSTVWSNQLAQEVLSMPTEIVSIRERRESNRERALRFMATQYGAHLRALLDDECKGDVTEFGRAIADLAGLTDEHAQAS